MPILGTTASSTRQGLSTTSFDSIASASGNGSATVITFSSIPSTYKHLQIRYVGRGTGSNTGYGVYLQFNGSSSAEYWNYRFRGRSGTASILPDTTANTLAATGAVPAANSGANMYGAAVIDILDYASTTKRKTVRFQSGADQNQSFDDTFSMAGANLWANTNAISSLTITIDSGNGWTTDSRFYLYGIKG
jgi:hypothetical protein